MAGPCSAENEAQTVNTAIAIKQRCPGVKYYRAGLWKPRTRPGSFEGIGAQALKWMRKARQATGMKILTEVASREHVFCAINGGIDAIWIGARTTSNPFAIQEIADSLKEINACNIEVWIKNPINPDIDLWLGAIERFSKAGINNIGAIHRGFSNYAGGIYRNPPHWAIPIELKRRLPWLTLLHDPSHTSGNSAMVQQLANEAMNLCFDGLMIETHLNPSDALSDAVQQITPAQLHDILIGLHKKNNISSDTLNTFRNEIDALDSDLVAILAKRMEISRQIGKYKANEGMPVINRERYSRLLSDLIKLGENQQLDKDFLKKIFSIIHEESVATQLKYQNK